MSALAARRKNGLKSKALRVTAERLEGSPPPELPDYGCNSVPKVPACKYIFRNIKVTTRNRLVVTQTIQNAQLLLHMIRQVLRISTLWLVT